MLHFYKNKLINKVLRENYLTFSQTLDTADYVPDKYNDKIYKIIFKNMKKQFKEVNKEEKIYLQNIKQKKSNEEKEKKKIEKHEKKEQRKARFKNMIDNFKLRLQMLFLKRKKTRNKNKRKKRIITD